MSYFFEHTGSYYFRDLKEAQRWADENGGSVPLETSPYPDLIFRVDVPARTNPAQQHPGPEPGKTGGK